MRKLSPIDSLLSKTTQGLLAATLLRPDRPWYLSDLAKHLGRTPSTLQGPLRGLVSAGVLSRRKDGNRVYFQANPDCPFLPELRGLMAKTVGLVDVLREVLAPLASRLAVAFVHGSVAASREQSTSDVDLITVGSLGLAEISPLLDKAEERLGRPVNVNAYSPEEFSAKVSANNHFLRSVLQKERLFIIGTVHDLERLTGRKSR
jgi:hypothetical protein